MGIYRRVFTTAAVCFAIQIGGCKSVSPETDLKIIRGKEISATENPSVIALVDSRTKQIYCTGTRTSPSVVLTAEHCLQRFPHITIDGVFPNLAIRSVLSAAEHSGGMHDLGVLSFRKEVDGPVAKFAPKGPVLGQEVIIIGFGASTCETPESSGTKRMGKNIVQRAEVSTFSIGNSLARQPSSPVSVDNSITYLGDSGGPAFLNGKLAGVLSAGVCDKYSVFVDLHSDFSAKFLSQAVGAGANIPGIQPSTEHDLIQVLRANPAF